MPQPLGERLFEVCEIVERIGPCTYRQVVEAHGEIELTNGNKYCERGVKHGLLLVDKSIKPAQFRVADGWRQRFKQPQPIRPMKQEKPMRFVASVFDLGSL